MDLDFAIINIHNSFLRTALSVAKLFFCVTVQQKAVDSELQSAGGKRFNYSAEALQAFKDSVIEFKIHLVYNKEMNFQAPIDIWFDGGEWKLLWRRG
jgi:hypothetical protein